MNNVAHVNFRAKPQNINGINHVLSTYGCQISPIVFRIQDDGPATIDPDFVKQAQSQIPNEKLKAPTETETESEPVQALMTNESVNTIQLRHFGTMITSVLILSICLVCIGVYAWQQKLQVDQLSAELSLIKDATKVQ